MPNHHGWFDGYLMFLAVSALKMPTVDWIQEFDSFPLFSKIGGMPFPSDRPEVRIQTIRKTIRLMNQEGFNLLLFAESKLHYPPDVLPFGKILHTLQDRVQGIQFVPVVICYEMVMHERPEAFLNFGSPCLPEALRDQLGNLLSQTHRMIREQPENFQVLAKGTPDVNERWQFPTLKR
ncbi:MAG TPA: hypothetical protein VJ835_02355 [Fimbriimonadaceae bacterium]|nr:hypothetical protein [Fimbriimonadaceae bacterium]